jgi:hypothetical protein
VTPTAWPAAKQVVGPGGPQTIGRRETAIEMTHVNRADRRQLMDDHLRPRPRHSLRDLIGIKRVRDHGHGAHVVKQRLLELGAGHARDLVAGGHQARDQLRANRSRRSCDKYSHR